MLKALYPKRKRGQLLLLFERDGQKAYAENQVAFVNGKFFRIFKKLSAGEIVKNIELPFVFENVGLVPYAALVNSSLRFGKYYGPVGAEIENIDRTVGDIQPHPEIVRRTFHRRRIQRAQGRRSCLR